MSSPTLTIPPPKYTIMPSICAPLTKITLSVAPVTTMPPGFVFNGAAFDVATLDPLLAGSTIAVKWIAKTASTVATLTGAPVTTSNTFSVTLNAPICVITKVVAEPMQNLTFEIGKPLSSMPLPKVTVQPVACQPFVEFKWAFDKSTPFTNLLASSVDVTTTNSAYSGTHPSTLLLSIIETPTVKLDPALPQLVKLPF